ncbi:hypothetical protein D1818_21330 [Aquimarina sp. BL5]|uniref:hypothetical protein n=1 Tax=Aquimarina sp. BL5 TaxID=1714860 RepID=UPI000E52F4A3|nr:hypothetical protein [Aquimarina sp. BL5]AXT53245.1 hypothetical protein D1818_21330 [Aquimarina sp. BL5]RKN01555.1 hypothetical protein D7036_17620 [Aquimarina sp. BL5]
MFSTGQLIFAGCFVVAFIILMIFSYRKDLKLHRKYYKGSIFILIGFIIFILLLFVLKTYLRPE